MTCLSCWGYILVKCEWIHEIFGTLLDKKCGHNPSKLGGIWFTGCGEISKKTQKWQTLKRFCGKLYIQARMWAAQKSSPYDNQPTAKWFMSSTSKTTMPKKAVTTGCQTSDWQNTHATLPTRSNDCAGQSGPKILSKQKVPLAKITCHACRKKGHYCGSKECPKTLTLACIHTLGIEPDKVKPETPEEPEEEVENPFKGEEFNGEADTEIATNDFDDDGIGAIIVGFHTISKDGEEESNTDITNIATLATTGKMESDEKLANELVSSIKEQYETWGSGYKAPSWTKDLGIELQFEA